MQLAGKDLLLEQRQAPPKGGANHYDDCEVYSVEVYKPGLDTRRNLNEDLLGRYMTQKLEAQPEQRRRILIVDDDPSVVHVLARTLLDLAQLNFSVRGEDALLKLMTHTPDLMVIDVEMPDLSGFDVIERMRRLPNGRQTQIIMVTSHDDDGYKKRAVQAGVADFFLKPIDRAVVRERVRELLESNLHKTIETNLPPAVDSEQNAADSSLEDAVENACPEQAIKPLVRSDAITSELFERMSAILEQTEQLRARHRKGLSSVDLQGIDRIEEQCAEVVQLLVTLSDPES